MVGGGAAGGCVREEALPAAPMVEDAATGATAS